MAYVLIVRWVTYTLVTMLKSDYLNILPCFEIIASTLSIPFARKRRNFQSDEVADGGDGPGPKGHAHAFRLG